MALIVSDLAILFRFILLIVYSSVKSKPFMQIFVKYCFVTCVVPKNSIFFHLTESNNFSNIVGTMSC